MNLTLLATLLITGFVGCAEFASVTLMHPVIRRLPIEEQMTMEKGLLRTFGRVMPLLMTAAPILAVMGAVAYGSGWLVSAAVVLAVALVVTILGNVPINLWTSRLRGTEVPEQFRAKRRHWDIYQVVRGSLQLLGFALTCAAVSQLIPTTT